MMVRAKESFPFVKQSPKILLEVRNLLTLLKFIILTIANQSIQMPVGNLSAERL
jgi:hypothetical protein